MRVSVLQTSDYRISVPLNETVFSIEKLREYSKRVIASFREKGRAISASNFKLDHGDSLYDYQLAAELFEGKVKLELSCEEIEMTFSSVTAEVYLEEVSEIAKTLIEGLDHRSDRNAFVTWNAHAVFENQVDFAAVMAPKVEGFTYQGSVGFIEKDPTRLMEIGKIAVEKSFSYDQAIYANAALAGVSRENAVNLRTIWDEVCNLLKPLEIGIIFKS